MHKHYIDMLECPTCHGDLQWHIKEVTTARIINASVICKSCGADYEVRDEIAVFLTPDLPRNDLWEQGESSLDGYFSENPEVFKRLMNTPEEELNGTDYWYKASYYELKGDYAISSEMFEKAFQKIYTEDHIKAWNSQMDFMVQSIKDSSKPVVDIASGKGYLIERLLLGTNNYILATDFSPTILVRNKEYYKFKGLYERLSLIAFDARRTPFKSNSIEILTSNIGLPNIEQPGSVVSELYRIAKDKFMSVMHFIDSSDSIHMDFFKGYSTTAYATRDNAIETFEKCGWKVTISNSIMAEVTPTPIGQIMEGLQVDGIPLENTKFEFCVIVAEKDEA